MKEAQKGTVGRNSKDKNPWCKFQRAITDASLADIMAKRNQNLKLGKLSENKLSELPRKQKRLSKHLKRQQWLLLRLPQRRHVSKRL